MLGLIRITSREVRTRAFDSTAVLTGYDESASRDSGSGCAPWY